jgi:hypothetical protein
VTHLPTMHATLLAVEHRWACPSCDLTDVTREPRPHSRMHNCAGLGGLSVPMVPAGTKAHHETHEREDYIGGERVQTDADGRPIMSVTTTRDDGQDCTVYAPTATARWSDIR